MNIREVRQMLGIDYEYQRLDRCWGQIMNILELDSCWGQIMNIERLDRCLGRIMNIREARQMLGTDYEYQ